MTPEPFRIDVADRDLDDLQLRLDRARLPADFDNTDWSYGLEGGYLREFVAYWRHDFDWRAVEAEMNAVPQFRVVLDGVPIHFLHVRGRGAAPLPLLLTPGWPWSFWLLRKVLEPLTDPAASGGDPLDAFDLVVPSLPGFGFSGPLRKSGVHAGGVAVLWVRLMREVLGYGRFAAGGGDWGAVVAAHLAHAHADDVLGVHLTMPAFVDIQPMDLRPGDFGPDEDGWYDRLRRKRRLIDTHLLVHTRSPQTLGVALNDSPVGLAAWLLERFRSWSDCEGDVERRFSKEDLATTIALYWFSESITTSLRLYAETFRHRIPLAHDRTPAMEAPTAISVFPEEVVVFPRAVAERHARLEQWNVMPRGGHFAPFEEPDLVVGELRTFFRRFR